MPTPNNNPFEIIDLNPEDIVVLWVSELGEDHHIQAGAKVRHALRERGFDNLVIALHGEAQLGAIDPELMARHGWVRSEGVSHGAA